jgi:hypothetical protein
MWSRESVRSESVERCEESDSGLPALVRDHPIRQVGVLCLSLLIFKRTVSSIKNCFKIEICIYTLTDSAGCFRKYLLLIVSSLPLEQ